MPGESVEAEALNLIVAKKKWEQQEKEIRELIMYAYGKDTVTEMYALEETDKSSRSARYMLRSVGARIYLMLFLSLLL